MGGTLMGAVVRFTPRERVAVLTCPVPDEWHVTCYEVGTAEILRHRVFHNPHHACNLLSVLECSWGHRIVLEPEAERWRSCLYYQRHPYPATGGAA